MSHLDPAPAAPQPSDQTRLYVRDGTSQHQRALAPWQDGYVAPAEIDGEGWQQLEDDLIYFEQNFGGVGLWPGSNPATPASAKMARTGIEHCDVSKLVEDRIQDYFRDPQGEADSKACKCICEHRAPLRFALDLLALGLAALALTYC